MTAISFSVKSWAAWTPAADGLDQWRGAAPAAAAPILLRRRIGRLGQRALQAAWAFSAALPPDAPPRLVFASRHGEFSRTLSILEALAEGAPPSPADFTLSVHHALAGLLSIATANHAGHTAIASGADSLYHALLEAAACQTERPEQPVLLAYYDEPLPPPYDDLEPGGETIALVLLLAPGGRALRLEHHPAAGPAGRHPGRDLAAVLDGGAAAVFQGDRLRWTLDGDR
ncbi:hypothetical protein GALL_80290 [mine drainage metagenome]|uniref:Beta-ketoacyl synthase-like N-terminal domain-containing protein n=1 Tax=mine drainage metagenome TaxID=410659 RepID=A0A1J5T1I1_9ZZZZ